MHHHRFPGQTNPAPAPPAGGFMLCPAALQGWPGPVCPWQHLYQLAYDQARAVVRPSLLERLQQACPN
jgi:hypothetical protein